MSAPRYPLLVQSSLKERLLAVVASASFFAFAMWMCVVTARLDDGVAWTEIASLVLFVGVGAGALWFAGYLWTFKTIFDASGVTNETVWGCWRFERSQLHGWRWGGAGAATVTVELYKKGGTTPFQVLVPKAEDGTIAAWFEGAQDLASVETMESLAEIEADENLGATPEERIKAADAETLILQRAHWFFLALALWALIFPRPYTFVVGAAIAAPVLVLLVTYVRRDRVRLWQGASKFRASTDPMIVLCICAILLRAIYDWRILDWVAPIAVALVGGTILAVLVLILFGERFANRDRVIGTLVSGVAYVYGALIPLNMWLDREPPQTLRGAVLELDAERVVIGAPAPFGEQLHEDISRSLAEGLVVGGPICIDLYRGAFRIRSYELRLCDN